MRRETWAAAGNDRSDFNLIAVVQHLVFGDEIVAFDHQMRFDDEIELAQEFLSLLGAFDFDGSGWMAQLDLHGGIISRRYMREQGCGSSDGRCVKGGWKEAISDGVGQVAVGRRQARCRARERSQPRPTAGAENQLFDLAQWPRERWVLDAKANRHLQRRLPQKLRRFFRCYRIDVEPCTPFEARHLGQLRNDFDVPVVEIPGLFVEGRTMEDKVI